MGFFEYNYVFNLDKNRFCQKILKWHRYLDDIFCLFQGKMEELLDFVSFLNGVYTDLKFSLEYDLQRVSFLDMWIELKSGGLITTLYRKPTDCNTFLLSSSAHPKALKNGLPKSQFYRLRHLCHSDDDYIEKSLEIKQRFLGRGYSAQCAEEAYQVALSKPRYVLLTKSVQKEKPFSVTCITTYTPQAHMFKNTILKYWHILTTDPALTKHFKDPPLFV